MISRYPKLVVPWIPHSRLRRAEDSGVLTSSFGTYGKDAAMSASNWDGKGGSLQPWGNLKKTVRKEKKLDLFEKGPTVLFKCYNNCGEDYPIVD